MGVIFNKSKKETGGRESVASRDRVPSVEPGHVANRRGIGWLSACVLRKVLASVRGPDFHAVCALPKGVVKTT